MRTWLITTGAGADIAGLRREVERLGGALVDEPVPLDGGEQAVPVEGPDDLPTQLAGHPDVRRVDPDSPVQMY